MPNDLLPLLEDTHSLIAVEEPWKILIIDDDKQIHAVTALALDGYSFNGRPVKILNAYSAEEGRKILQSTSDIALILLDVVMESEHAGLDLVQFIRVRQRNTMVRIVLRTGQPGQAPPLDVVQTYDIDDYRTKTELTFDRLYVVVTTALRTYDLLHRMAESQQQLAHLANHDALTGLPNRALLHDRIDQALAQAKRNGKLVAFLFIDLDGFKYINDSFGHTLGDGLLQALARRLEEVTREGDTIARLGGDEFVIILNGVNSSQDVSTIANKLLLDLPLPLTVKGRSLTITASIGFSIYPLDGTEREDLLRYADVALYAAKQRGRNCVQAYMKEMTVLADERVELENALRQALSLRQFELHYQPRIEMSTGEISGVEALIRWKHPKLGNVPPLRFIRLAEEIGLIIPISEWVFSTACRQLQAWHLAGHRQLTMAVNMSARQFHEQDVVALVRDLIQVSDIPASTLELELTESILISNPEAVVVTLRELKALGVSLSMDDFGTGYSSLSYLSRFPIDTIKIDQSFTSRLTQSSEADSITRAIIALAKSLKMKTIGEGVETVEQLNFLMKSQCDSIQGYYFSRPIPAEQMTKMLSEHKPPAGLFPKA